eukprot:1035347-Prorocentrum_minimum.AAC.1
MGTPSSWRLCRSRSGRKGPLCWLSERRGEEPTACGLRSSSEGCRTKRPDLPLLSGGEASLLKAEPSTLESSAS